MTFGIREEAVLRRAATLPRTLAFVVEVLLIFDCCLHEFQTFGLFQFQVSWLVVVGVLNFGFLRFGEVTVFGLFLE